MKRRLSLYRSKLRTDTESKCSRLRTDIDVLRTDMNVLWAIYGDRRQMAAPFLLLPGRLPVSEKQESLKQQRDRGNLSISKVRANMWFSLASVYELGLSLTDLLLLDVPA